MPWVKNIWETSLPKVLDRGYLIPAINTADTDYVACASKLAHSIRAWHPDAKICLLTDRPNHDPVFDIVRLLPHGDQAIGSDWKLSNDWQVFEATPFEHTVKLEADMWLAGSFDHWWDTFVKHDLIISLGCRDFYGQPSKSRYYRKIFDENNLPDVYNAITYWKNGPVAREFFSLVKNMFEHWDTYKVLLKYPDDRPTTDVVYALASVVMGIERTTLPQGIGPTMVHMKRHIIPIQTPDWTNELVLEKVGRQIKINTVTQWGFVHYHIKEANNEQ
jgi:hypothetical protein